MVLPAKVPLVPPVQKVVSSLNTWQERGSGVVPVAEMEMLSSAFISNTVTPPKGLEPRACLRLGRVLVVAEPRLVDGEVEAFRVELENRCDLVLVGAAEGRLALARQRLRSRRVRQGSSARGRVSRVVVPDDHKGIPGLEIPRNAPEVDLRSRHLPFRRPRLGRAAFGVVSDRPWEIRRRDLDRRKQRSFDKQGLRRSAARRPCTLVGRAAQGDPGSVSSRVSSSRESDAGIQDISNCAA